MQTNNIKNLIRAFYPYAKQKLGFNKPAKVKYINNDMQNAADPFGKTAHYEPDKQLVTLYIMNRHPKDILRSFAHELTHHAQHCRGDLNNSETYEGYAQNDPHMRDMEREAYESALLVRDWTDTLSEKQKQELIMENDDKVVKRVKKTLQDEEDIQNMLEDRRLKLNKKLLDKFVKPKEK